jgi:protein involved in polysaccharide export with SLBB domain
LTDGDEVQVFTILDVLRNYAIVKGSVWRPGRYELDGVQTVSQLIEAAQGIQPQTYGQIAHIIRFNEDEVTTRIIPFDLSRALTDKAYDHRLMPRDEVIVYSREIVEQRNTFVTIRGAVKNPGRFALRDDLTLADLIPLAAGYSEGAEISEAEVSRFIPSGASGDTLVTILKVPLPSTFTTDGNAQGLPPFILQHRDEVYIRTKPNFMPQQNVSISGDMMYPGVYAVQRRGERLSEFLNRAGGPTSSSYLGGARFYREGERVLVDFTEAFYEKNQLHDILMMGGDSIVVPSRPHTVLVVGEVNKPGRLSFLEGDDVSDYIDRAGGITDSALYVLLTKPTGETRKVEFGLFSADPTVLEGSTIEVLKELPPPPPAEKIDFFGTIKDVFALLASVAAVIFIVHETTK